MPDLPMNRRHVAQAIASMPLWPGLARAAEGGAEKRLSIVECGAVADNATVNTAAIQQAVDRLAANGGGTVVVPTGIFVTGALDLRPGVHLHLEEGAVLRCSTDMAHFPPRRTRIEGHFEDSFTPALINAAGCDGLRITGSGTLDGAGRPIWDRFWQLRNAAPVPNEFPNLGVPRARLALVENSADVLVEGVTFRDSQFWNLHLYKCHGVTVRNARFEVPDDYKQAPSSDGVDIDSCQDVMVEGCHFSVTDDCIACKGSKGVNALSDKDSPPVERVRVRGCTFRRGHHALACGSEATIIRDVVVEDCRVTGDMVLLRLKLRPDTPQLYQDIHMRSIVLDSAEGEIISLVPWTQYVDLQGQAPPRSVVSNVVLSGITGHFGSFGAIRPDLAQTDLSGITFRDIDVRLRDAKPDIAVGEDADALMFDDVVLNGTRFDLG